MHNLAALPVKEAFAGPGGWSEALKALGITDCVGYEWDTEACATAEAAGHKRVQADVSMVDLRDLPRWMVGAILSPPCQSFSSAGKQKGKLDKPRIMAHVDRIRAAGRWLHYSRDGWHDPRSPLVLEPLRWVLTLMPAWVALEQVPPVLPLWEAFADVYREHGYHVATGILSAEQYGVAQTRKRAFLIARYCRTFAETGTCSCEPLRLPEPTHRAYRKGVARHEGDPALLPWVSMADALGWTEGVVGMQLRQSAQVNATVRHEEEPAPTITAGHDRAERVWEPVAARFGNQPNSAVRAVDEPAATVRYSERMNACDWLGDEEGVLPLEMHPSGVKASEREGRSRVAPRREDEPAGTVTGSGRTAGYWTTQRVPRSPAFGERPGRDVETEPSFTITGSGNNGGGAHHAPQWSDERPATTVAGDARIWPPGYKVNGDDRARLGEAEANSRYGDRAGTKAVRVSVAEAAVLQSFRPDYPFQGSKTAQYRQVGDAVPPVLAEAVLRAVLGL